MNHQNYPRHTDTHTQSYRLGSPLRSMHQPSEDLEHPIYKWMIAGDTYWRKPPSKHEETTIDPKLKLTWKSETPIDHGIFMVLSVVLPDLRSQLTGTWRATAWFSFMQALPHHSLWCRCGAGDGKSCNFSFGNEECCGRKYMDSPLVIKRGQCPM